MPRHFLRARHHPAVTPCLAVVTVMGVVFPQIAVRYLFLIDYLKAFIGGVYGGCLEDVFGVYMIYIHGITGIRIYVYGCT